MDNKAIYAGLLIIVWIFIDYLKLGDPDLVLTLKYLIGGLGFYHVAMSKPGE